METACDIISLNEKSHKLELKIASITSIKYKPALKNVRATFSNKQHSNKQQVTSQIRISTSGFYLVIILHLQHTEQEMTTLIKNLYATV